MNDLPLHMHADQPVRWHGNPRQYQIEAQQRFAIAHDRGVLPWSYITTDCEVDQCLEVRCMTLHSAKRIKYPADICVYCGEPGYTRDHLMPEPMTGGALRAFIAVVPACRGCNSRIGDFPSWNIAERRRLSQTRIERKNKYLLLSPHKDHAHLMELGPTMRTVAVRNNVKRRRIKAQLAWPFNPFFDIRAFQKTGIEDPESLGLCDAIATPLRSEYQDEESA